MAQLWTAWVCSSKVLNSKGPLQLQSNYWEAAAFDDPKTPRKDVSEFMKRSDAHSLGVYARIFRRLPATETGRLGRRAQRQSN